MRTRTRISNQKIKEIIELRKQNMSFGKIAEMTGISKGTCYRICKGEYHNPRTLPAPVCPECGVVHSKVCRPSFAARLAKSGLPENQQAAIKFIFDRLNRKFSA